MKQPPTDTKLRLHKASDAPKRVKSVIRGIFESLGIKQPTQLHCVLAARAAELTVISEELSSRLLAGDAISVEVIGRNADRLQRTLNELRKHAPIHVTRCEDDEDEDDNLPAISRRFIRR
jgi:hypothetical protein